MSAIKQMTRLGVLALQLHQARSNALKTLSTLSAKFAKSRDPVQAKVLPMLQNAAKLRGEILRVLPEVRGEFVEPKSKVLHGIKIGFKKGQDTLVYDEEALLKQCAAMPNFAHLIGSKSYIRQDAIKALNDSEKSLLGITVQSGTDEPICHISDGLEANAKALGIDLT